MKLIEQDEARSLVDRVSATASGVLWRPFSLSTTCEGVDPSSHMKWLSFGQ